MLFVKSIELSVLCSQCAFKLNPFLEFLVLLCSVLYPYLVKPFLETFVVVEKLVLSFLMLVGTIHAVVSCPFDFVSLVISKVFVFWSVSFLLLNRSFTYVLVQSLDCQVQFIYLV